KFYAHTAASPVNWCSRLLKTTVGRVAKLRTYATFTIKFLALSHDGATMVPMKADRKDSRSSALERINLRLSPEVLEAIDAECSRRAGSVSRNTWITEAVTERLARLASSSRPQGTGGANG
ncbi:hypothetical protein, partial [Serratia marcescens]|uniref:hypothetical protein n=1 Tax=Serratia marcescens TaxID=615 RepID=UPI001F150404